MKGVLWMKKELQKNEELLFQLLNAVLNNNKEEVLQYLSDGANVNGTVEESGLFRKNIYGPSLELAMYKEHYDLVNLLLDNGADPKMLSKTAIEELLKKNQLATIDKLLAAGLPFRREYNDPFDEKVVDYDILISALSKENIELVQIVLRHGADISIYEDGGTRIPLVSRYLHSFPITQSLLDYSKYDINKPFKNNQLTLLIEAVKIRATDTALYLLEQGSFPESIDEHGQSPLYFAVRYKDVKVARVLLEKGANPNRIYFGQTLAAMAATNADFLMLQLLLEFDANVNAGLPGGKKPIELIPNYDQFMSFMVLYKKQ